MLAATLRSEGSEPVMLAEMQVGCEWLSVTVPLSGAAVLGGTAFTRCVPVLSLPEQPRPFLMCWKVVRA